MTDPRWTGWGLGFHVSDEAAFFLLGPVGITIRWRRP